MPVAINMPERQPAQIGAILQALQAVKTYYGIDTEKQQNAILEHQANIAAKKEDPTSSVSNQARQEQQATLDYLHSRKAINDSQYGNLHAAIFGTGDQGPMSAADLEKNPEMSSIVSLYKTQLQADAMSGKFNSINDTKKEIQENAIHQQVLGKLQKDPTLSKQLIQYQNLNNALANITQSDHITPQQFDEFQQSVKSNLGIKGSSGVDERSHTYLNSLGLNTDRWQQMLTGRPATMSPDDPFLQHVKQLATIEQGNIQNQTQKRMGALTQGNQWLYNRRPDLKAGLDSAIEATAAQYSPTNGGQSPSPNGGGIPLVSSAQAASVPKVGDIEQGHRYKGGDPRDPNSWEKVQ